jgi:hypothetical protein
MSGAVMAGGRCLSSLFGKGGLRGICSLLQTEQRQKQIPPTPFFKGGNSSNGGKGQGCAR